jgi:hypothetical protein
MVAEPPSASDHPLDHLLGGAGWIASSRPGAPSPRFLLVLWALQGLNLRLPPCEGGTLPLS